MSNGVKGLAGRVVLLIVLLGVGAGLVAWRVVPEIREDRASRDRILAATGGRLSDNAVDDLAERMDPAAAALARRAEGATQPRTPSAWGWHAANGWAGANQSLARGLNTLTPLDEAVLRPAPPFVFRGSARDRARALRCLSLAVYYESALEPADGQAAVAQVVLNRVRDPDFPPTICGVVFQGAEVDFTCQFTFACDGSMAWGEVKGVWRRSERIAAMALDGRLTSPVGTATYYHADYVMPWWRPRLVRLGPVGRHIFYRGRGPLGEPSALSRPYRGGEPYINEARFARPRERPVDGDAMEAAEATPRPGPPGRRRPTREEIEQINRTLRAFEAQSSPPARPEPAPESPSGSTQTSPPAALSTEMR